MRRDPPQALLPWPRVLALLPGAPGSQALLRATCTYWARMGHKTVVLDGCASESRQAPGLHQLLGGKPLPRQGACSLGRPTSGPVWHEITVLPARLGLGQLCDRGTAPASLHRQLGQPSIIVLHAEASRLGQLAALPPGPPPVPLLLLEHPPGHQVPWSHLLSSCQRLQQLAQHGVRHCLLALLTAPPIPGIPTIRADPPLPDAPPEASPDAEEGDDSAGEDGHASLHAQIQALRDCARRCAMRPCAVLSLRQHRADDTARFALAWLEHALAGWPHTRGA